mgnify:FL=1|tara:strand:+ start:9395 stop:10753 length:1359 start_codon:yes stop_codon:yes gene_type:complete
MQRDSEAIDYVVRTARENDVKFIRMWFTDILGNLKGVAVTVEELESALTRGIGFDGASIEGFARSNENDMFALPDPTTFNILPWRPRQNAVARMFCDILTPDGTPFEGDPRFVLRQNLERASRMGYTYYVSPEIEYFYFKDSKSTDPLDQGGYFDQDPQDLATDLRRETVLTLEELGIPVEFSHHEVAPSQHEIDLRHTDALTMADTVMTYRVVVKEIAMKHGYYATFMPKPIQDVNGNGMHVHQSLFKGDSNIFFDSNDPDKLSTDARQFIAGLLKHSKEITSVTNQWVNSYKRLVENSTSTTLGYEAPTYITWAMVNKSDLIRVPSYKPGREQSRRIEYRAPDPACNPYLAFSAMLAAGLAGIKNAYELQAPSDLDDSDPTNSNYPQRKDIDRLPDNLSEALKFTENSELVKNALGKHVLESFLQNKKIEWEQYKTQVTNYEIQKYLPRL